MKVLVIDVGGTNVKVLATGQTEVRKIPSGPKMTAEQMVKDVQEATKDWDYDAVSIGYPGPVVQGKPLLEPKNLGPGWVDFDFTAAFKKPVRVVNDAAMQALGSYRGGRMLFLGLGTGLGSTLVLPGVVMPLELGDLPYCEDLIIEDFLGKLGLEELGEKEWQRDTMLAVAQLKKSFIADYVILGGGNAKKLKELPKGTELGHNRNAYLGGLRLWQIDPRTRRPK